jgi:Na+-transporting NADH:ubiquinone oxidoreductase subunit F
VIKIATPPAIAPANTPPGRASSYLFGLKPGDRLTLSGPFGTFNATANEKEMVLIAGGAGIAPIRSIILDQLARRTSRKMSLWFGARDLHDLCYYNEFEDLARAHGNFRVHAVLSNPAGDDGWTGDTGFVHTVVHEKFLKDHRAPAEAEYYLCGPPLMAEAVLQMLDKLGVEPDNIFLDDFGS